MESDLGFGNTNRRDRNLSGDAIATPRSNPNQIPATRSQPHHRADNRLKIPKHGGFKMKRKQLNRKYQGWIDEVTSRHKDPKQRYWYYRYVGSDGINSFRIRDDKADYVRYKLYEQRCTISEMLLCIREWWYYSIENQR